jgi:glycosyltransferase involved in cell wall biosynthesis
VASGEWIVLIDSDIIVPPNLFKKLAEAESGAHFIAPDGRRMLTPETTSRVLLGEVRPWEEFDAVAASTDDYRYREGAGVPCGFFQAVRRDVLEALPYQELDHFEGSDWIFGRDVINRFGKETRLEGVDVLHLDHGGRQWYGTEKHR